MSNRLFSDDMIRILTSIDRWRIISSRFTPEVEPVADWRHEAWSMDNCQGHSIREALIVLGGKANYGFKQKVYPCVPGAVFLFDSYEEHDSDYVPWCTNAEHLWIYFHNDTVLMRVLSIKDGAYRSLPGSSTMLSASSLPLSLFTASQHPLEPAEVVRFRTISALAVLVMSFIDLGYAEESGDSREFRQTIISAVEQRIRETCGSSTSLDSLARVSGYSKFHLERLFKERTGCTIHQYVDRCRAAKCKEMIGNGHSLKEISSALGFSHQSSFSRWRKSGSS
jgi:AraC-like DNA-binding protein